MLIYANIQDIDKALRETNKLFHNNILFGQQQRTKHRREVWSIRLRCRDSNGSGHRISYYGRRLISACWHVHKAFFDNLPEGTKINTKVLGRQVFYTGGEYPDPELGYRTRLSNLCHCNPASVFDEDTPIAELRLSTATTLLPSWSQSSSSLSFPTYLQYTSTTWS